jgi:uncharacterized membrane protein
MERYRRRLIVGAALMAVGFGTVLVALTELVTERQLPAWTWGLFLLVGVGAAVVISAFRASARDRRNATEALLGTAQRPAARR